MSLFIVPHKLFLLICANTFLEMDVKNWAAYGKGAKLISIILIININTLNII